MKLSKVLLQTLAIFVTMTSCSENEPIDPQISTAAADAAAFTETFLLATEACPICVTTPVGQAAILAASAVVGSDASGVFGRSRNEFYSSGKTSNIILPKKSLIAENPFEKYGIKHNVGLNYINSIKDFYNFHAQICKYDEQTWLDLLDIQFPEMSLIDKRKTIETAKEIDVISQLRQRQAFLDNTDINSIYRYISSSSASQKVKDKLAEIMKVYNKMINDKKSNDEIVNYLNLKINEEITSESDKTTQNESTIIFLTILKHSTFYWNE